MDVYVVACNFSGQLTGLLKVKLDNPCIDWDEVWWQYAGDIPGDTSIAKLGYCDFFKRGILPFQNQ